MRQFSFCCCMMLALGLAGCETFGALQSSQVVPTSVTVPPPRRDSMGNPSPNIFVSLLNQNHPDNRIGYRLFEYEPITRGAIPAGKQTPAEAAVAGKLEADYAARAGVFRLQIDVTNKAGWAPMLWTYYLVPVPDGYEMLWVVETMEQGLNDYYIAQQCLRFSGVHNSEWRRSIAETPAFSEFDQWKKQEETSLPRTSLSFVRRQAKWEPVPPSDICIVCPTPLGLALEAPLPGEEPALRPDVRSSFSRQGQPSQFAAPADCGLMIRGASDEKWLCAIYWDRTTHLSVHHPADCLHSYVNLGPMPPHGKRAIEGKIYWLNTSKNNLYARWRKDWPMDKRP